MSFALDAGYIPLSISALMSIIRENVNAQFGTTYTEETFLGTNFYKFYYALVQRLQDNETKTSEIFAKLREYFNTTNELIQRPNTTPPGIYDYFKARGYFVSVKPPVDADAGKAFICVDVDDTADDYAAQKLLIAGYIKDCVVAGVVSQGTESETITLDNFQSFDFKFFLPNKIAVKLRVTLTLSENNQFAIQSPDVVKARLLENVAARYRLGMNFEPQRYFSILDAPWAGSVLLEWSDDDGATWSDDIYDAEFDDVFTFTIADITVVEA